MQIFEIFLIVAVWSKIPPNELPSLHMDIWQAFIRYYVTMATY